MPTYVGLDVHKKVCHATVMDERGEVMKEGKFENTREGFEKFFDGIDDAKVAMEAGYCWQPAYELLECRSYEVKLAHPRRTRVIAETKIKTDAKDSKALAHLLRLDWLPTAYVPSKGTRELRELVRLRTYLVRERTRLKNKIHAELAKRGIRANGSKIFAKCRRQLLREIDIEAVNHCLSVLETLDERIKEISAELKRRAGESEEARLLMTIPGVDYFTALLVLSEIGDIDRFLNEEKLCSHAGLVPSTKQSGCTARRGHITKEGSGLLRWALVESVWVHLRYDTKLTRSFWKLARRKGKKVAATATARKLLVAIYWMLKRGEEFRA